MVEFINEDFEITQLNGEMSHVEFSVFDGNEPVLVSCDNDGSLAKNIYEVFSNGGS